MSVELFVVGGFRRSTLFAKFLPKMGHVRRLYLTEWYHAPGFADFPEGFQIHLYELGRTGWGDGFFRVSQ
jgi:hypothetical protein